MRVRVRVRVRVRYYVRARVRVRAISLSLSLTLTLTLTLFEERATDASAASVRRVLKAGLTPAIIPGGFSEAVYTNAHPTEEYAYLADRTGFVRLAIEHGVDIIPAYSYGLNDMYTTWGEPYPNPNPNPNPNASLQVGAVCGVGFGQLVQAVARGREGVEGGHGDRLDLRYVGERAGAPPPEKRQAPCLGLDCSPVPRPAPRGVPVRG